MNELPDTWDQTTPLNPGKSLDLRFLATMTGRCCQEMHTDRWGDRHPCVRNDGHGGRHLGISRHYYVTAVWR